MKLVNAAKSFDKLVLADAYVPATTFKGQFDLFDESRRDGMSVERRILSVASGVTIPPRRTVIANGTTWLVGDGHDDYFKASVIRTKYVLHQATDLAVVKTFDQALAASAGSSIWTSRLWVKGSKEIDISSDVTDVFNFYFAAGESIALNQLIYANAQWHIVRSLFPGTAGHLIAMVDELPEPVVTTATFDKRAYNPVTDAYATTPTTIAAIRLRWQSHFRYQEAGVEEYSAGDIVLIVLKATITPTPGDKVTVGGVVYRLDSVVDEGTTLALRLCHD